MNIQTYNTNGIAIFSGALARKLLRKGYCIIDLKPNKLDRKMTVFIFEKEGEILKDIDILKMQIK